MANRFFGSYRSLGPRQQRANKSALPRGVARLSQSRKHIEADARNLATLPERRRQARLEAEALEFNCSVRTRTRRQRQLSRMNRGR